MRKDEPNPGLVSELREEAKRLYAQNLARVQQTGYSVHPIQEFAIRFDILAELLGPQKAAQFEVRSQQRLAAMMTDEAIGAARSMQRQQELLQGVKAKVPAVKVDEGGGLHVVGDA